MSSRQRRGRPPRTLRLRRLKPRTEVAPVLDRMPIEALVASCSGKKRYPTEETAKRVAASVWQRRGTFVRAYACDAPGCGGWHLTRRHQ